jgi:hypothetical protein
MMKPHSVPTMQAIRCACVTLCFLLLDARGIQAQQTISQSKLEAELVILRDGGFYPPTITRPAGNFILLVKNRSHANQVQLSLTRSDASVIAASEQVNDINKAYVLVLTAGTYTLQDSAHPSWGQLTIVAK